MKHRLKTAILKEDQTRGQQSGSIAVTGQHHYILIGMFRELVFRIWILPALLNRHFVMCCIGSECDLKGSIGSRYQQPFNRVKNLGIGILQP
jgi:hypothetical protein